MVLTPTSFYSFSHHIRKSFHQVKMLQFCYSPMITSDFSILLFLSYHLFFSASMHDVNSQIAILYLTSDIISDISIV